MTNILFDSSTSSMVTARAISELFVLLTLARKPLEEADLALFELLRDTLAAASPLYAQQLAMLGRRHFIEALGQLHCTMSMDAARQKCARDLGKTLAPLPEAEKKTLCAMLHEHFCTQDDPLLLTFYTTLGV